MKTATLPPVRVAPDFRQELESVLAPGETPSRLVKIAVRGLVEKRKHQAELVRRGMVAIEDTQRTGGVVAAQEVVARLEAKLQAARQTHARRAR